MLGKFMRREKPALSTKSLIPASVSVGGAGYGLSRNNADPRAQSTIDQSLLWAVLALLLMGLVMVYSATIALPDSRKFASYETTHFFVRHFISLLVAFAAAFFVFQIPMKSWQQAAPALFLACIGLLILVLIPGIGKEVNGSRRWLSLYVLNIQPSELMKVCAIMYAADYSIRKQQFMQRFGKVLLPMMIAMFLVGALLLLEPDLGALVVIVAVVFAILFLGGINARVFFIVLAFLLIAFALLVYFSDYRRERVIEFMNPWTKENSSNKSYQVTHSLIAFGRGEFFGVGLGGSVEKLHYLPEAHTDFLLAVIAEELGFVGILSVILLFAFIVKRCFTIGSQAILLERPFNALVAKGVGVWIGVQMYINMAVNVGLLPTKGLTLPLMSYGGSAILANCIGLAIVLRIDHENRTMMRGGTT